jgi:hypothetical protein
MTQDNETVYQYWRNAMPAVEVTGIVEQSGCFNVKVTYGEVGKTSSEVT